MKNLFSIFSLTLLLCTSISAQNYVTARGGGALGNQSNIEGSLRIDFSGALGYEFQIKEPFWIHSEISFISKGIDIGVAGNLTQFKTKINYFEVPVLLKYKYFYNGFFDWAVGIGPHVGVANKAENRFFQIGQPTSQQLTIDSDNGVNPIDIGLTIGFDLNFVVDYGYISLYTRYNQGFVNVYNDAFNDIPDIKNQTIEFGLMFKFGKKHELEYYEEGGRVKTRRSRN